MPTNAGKTKKYKKDTAESIEDHYRANYFLSFFDHIISHLNSRFPQELKAIFYACVGLKCFTSIVMILSVRLFQKLFSKDGIRVAIGKSILHSPTKLKYCHLNIH